MLVLDWTNAAQQQPQGWAFSPVLQMSYGAVHIVVRRIAIFGRIEVIPMIGVASVTLNEDESP